MTEFVSGWAGGCCGRLLGHPFDTVKVRQQALGHTSLAAALQDTLKQVGSGDRARIECTVSLNARQVNVLKFKENF